MIELTKLRRLRRLRTRAGLTQQGLAMKSGLHESTVRKLEAGRHGATDQTAVRLADALGVTIAELYGIRIIEDAQDEEAGRPSPGVRFGSAVLALVISAGALGLGGGT